MTRIFVKIIFLFLAVFCLVRISDSILKEEHFYEKTICEYKKEDNILLGIFGSSRAHSNFDPRIFELDLGLKTFNFGAPAQKFEATTVVAKTFLNDHDPKFVIIDIFSLSIGEYFNNVTKNNQLATLNEAPLSCYKIKKLNEIFGREKLLPKVFPTIGNHDDWIKLIDFTKRSFSLENGIDFYKGFRTYNKVIDSSMWRDFAMKYDGKNIERNAIQLSDKEKEKIDEIIEIFENQDVEILFVNSPTYVSEVESYFREYSKSIEAYIKSKGIVYIEFNEIKDSLNLDWNFYSDPNHLNANGARIVSEYLSQYIFTA